MTLSMTLTLTNDSLLLLGLVIVTLTCCLYGYCKGGGDAIEVQQQQYDGTADGAPNGVANGVANGATDGATDEDKQDTVEDEARDTAAAVDETLNQDEEARDETSTNEETALDGTILAQQQYRVLYNLTHMWTIFRNPNPGMISLYQLIHNLFNMATWASAGLPIENNEEEEEEEDDDDDEEEEYNAGYFKRKSSKLDYDKVCEIVTDLSNKFPAINYAMHAHVHLLRQMNLNVNELKYKFYVSIAEALDGCPEYIKWIVPYYRQSVPAEVVEEEEKEEDNDFPTTYDENDPVEVVPPPPGGTATRSGQDAAATAAAAAGRNTVLSQTTSGISKDDWTQQDTHNLQKCIEKFGDDFEKILHFFPYKTKQELKQIIRNGFRRPPVLPPPPVPPPVLSSDDENDTLPEQIIGLSLSLPKSTPNDDDNISNGDRSSSLDTQPSDVNEDLPMPPVAGAQLGDNHGVPPAVLLPPPPLLPSPSSSVVPTNAAVSAVTHTVLSKTKKKPAGIKKGTKLKRTKSSQVWFNGVHIYHHKYSHKKIKVTEFCRGNLSDERFTGSTSECNGFYKKYSAYLEGELKNPSGDDRSSTVAGVTELQTEGTNDVFDFPTSDDDSPMAATVCSYRRKRKRNNTGSSSNSQQKKKPYIPTEEDDASDPEWKPSRDGDDDDDDE